MRGCRSGFSPTPLILLNFRTSAHRGALQQGQEFFLAVCQARCAFANNGNGALLTY